MLVSRPRLRPRARRPVRRPLFALAAAGMLTLAACGSTAGTPAAQDLAVAGSGNVQQSRDRGAGTGDQHDGDVEDGADSADVTGPATDTGAIDPTTEPRNASVTEPPPTGSPSETEVPSETETETRTTTETATTVSGDLDAQTAAWFSEMCTGTLKPFFNATGELVGAGVAGALGDAGSSAADPAALRQQVVETLGAASSTIERGLEKLKSMPPPAVDQADDIVESVVVGMQSSIQVFRAAADELAAAPVTDLESLGEAITELNALDTLEDATTVGPDLDDQLQADVMNLPACNDVYGPLAGLANVVHPPAG